MIHNLFDQDSWEGYWLALKPQFTFKMSPEKCRGEYIYHDQCVAGKKCR